MSVLRVNPIACDAHGLCADLFPERVTLDDWGYPIIDPRPISPELRAHARRAVQACPTLALLLVSAEAPGHRAMGARRQRLAAQLPATQSALDDPRQRDGMELHP